MPSLDEDHQQSDNAEISTEVHGVSRLVADVKDVTQCQSRKFAY